MLGLKRAKSENDMDDEANKMDSKYGDNDQLRNESESVNPGEGIAENMQQEQRGEINIIVNRKESKGRMDK